ncbi:MAG: lysophospholipid acyltransferase family protein [Egibacteraceae bacterium]
MGRPWWRGPLTRASWNIGWVVLRLTCRIHVDGEVPSGPAVLVSNHPSYLDGPLALYLSPRVRVVAKSNPIPYVRRAYGMLDVFVTGHGAVEAARAHLDRGGLLWIVPEGHLSNGPLGRPRRGAARLAARTGVPIVTAAIVGTAGLRLGDWRPWRRPAVRVILGRPRFVRPEDDLDTVSHDFMRELSQATGTPYVGDMRG